MSYVDVNGLSMYYQVVGDGPWLLLLHGGSGSMEYFSTAIPFFASQFRVIGIEQMGHGRTADIPARPFHYHDMAEDTVEVIRQLGIESILVLGYSDGGIIGLDVAIHHPELVTRLVVTGANTSTDGYTEANLEWVRTFGPDGVAVPEEYGRLSPDGRNHWPTLLERLKAMWLVEPSFTPEQIQGVSAPTLIIIGDGDIVTPEHAVEMFRTIPHAQLCVVPHAGHGILPMETILTFLQEPTTMAD